jgi:hypothetical protein
MDGRQVQAWQAERIRKSLDPAHAYLGRLKGRMERLGFPATDPFYADVAAAQRAVQALWMHCHYLSCHSGVGRPQRA